MNGEEKRFFETEFIKLKAQTEERWKNHEDRSNDLRNFLDNTFKKIDDKIANLCNNWKEISSILNRLPCDVREQKYNDIKEELNTIRNNDLKHLNIKINTLLFTVLGSIFVVILVSAINFLVSKY